jgi:hypothetical protein
MTMHRLSGKGSCQRCWTDSLEQGVEYIDVLRSNHHAELVRHFEQDRCLQMQRESKMPVRHHKSHKLAA